MELEDILSLLRNVKKTAKGFTARCPAHDDHKNSLSIRRGEKKVLLHCFAGCTHSAVTTALGLSDSELFYQRTGDVSMAEVVYPYRDDQGNVLYEVVRKPQKKFIQRRPDGSGGYVYDLQNIRRVLYRLPEVLQGIADNKSVLLCEGEKDVHSILPFEAALGVVATTNSGGAASLHSAVFQPLHGAKVYVAYDNDAAGRERAAKLLEMMPDSRLFDIFSDYPDAPEHADLSDYIALKGADAFQALNDLFLDSPKDATRLMPLNGPESVLKYSSLDYVGHVQKNDPASNLMALTGEFCLDAAPANSDSLSDYLKDKFYNDIELSSKAAALSTGFPSLDEQLDRLYSGLYVIGSVSSMGKTAFCAQMADNIAAQGAHVLFFSLEMSRFEMVARSIARELFISNPLKYSEINVGHVMYGRIDRREIAELMNIYANSIAKNIFLFEGNFDLGTSEIRTIVEDHVKRYNIRPIVFIDYLQVLRPSDIRLSDKQAVDHSIIALKRLSRDLDIPVIAISSFNRSNYSESVNFSSFKESGAIEYSADFVMGLQARGVQSLSDESDFSQSSRKISNATRSAKQLSPRPIEAVILKNRRGAAWATFNLEFYAGQNYFKESLNTKN